MSNKTLFTLSLNKREAMRLLSARPAAHVIESGFRQFARQGMPQLAVFSRDLIGSHINTYGLYERDELELLMEWLKATPGFSGDGICLDVGANIGNHSVFFSRHFSKVIAFEPNPWAHQLLQINAQWSDKIECRSVALSDRAGQATIHFNLNNMGGGSLVAGEGERSAQVQTVRLDNLEFHEPIKLIKIDVEGHELGVIEGSQSTIEKHRPVILFEQHPEDFHGGTSPVVDALKRLGYRKFAKLEIQPTISRSRLKNAFTFFRVMLWGRQGRVVMVDEITPGFYPFVVAIP